MVLPSRVGENVALNFFKSNTKSGEINMKESVLRAIESVSSSSALAAAIVDSLTPDKPLAEDDIARLKSQVALMQHEILKLKLTTLDDAPNMTDDERHSLEIQFMAYVNSIDKSQLNAKFNRSFFQPHPTQVRYVLALALYNHMVQIKQQASAVILDLIASNGAL